MAVIILPITAVTTGLITDIGTGAAVTTAAIMDVVITAGTTTAMVTATGIIEGYRKVIYHAGMSMSCSKCLKALPVSFWDIVTVRCLA